MNQHTPTSHKQQKLSTQSLTQHSSLKQAIPQFTALQPYQFKNRSKWKSKKFTKKNPLNSSYNFKHLKLALLIISDKAAKAPLKRVFDILKLHLKQTFKANLDCIALRGTNGLNSFSRKELDRLVIEENYHLKLQVQKLSKQKENLNRQLREISKIQESEFFKKSECLKILGEEIEEKDNIIQQLKQNICAMEAFCTQKPYDLFLEESPAELEAQRDRLCSANDKLYSQLMHKNQQLNKSNLQISSMKETINDLRKQIKRLKEINFQKQMESILLKEKAEEWQLKVQEYKEKISRVLRLEANLNRLLKGSKPDTSITIDQTISQFRPNKESKISLKTQSQESINYIKFPENCSGLQIKLQAIFQYLGNNVDLQLLPSPGLFTAQEKQLLQQIKSQAKRGTQLEKKNHINNQSLEKCQLTVLNVLQKQLQPVTSAQRVRIKQLESELKKLQKQKQNYINRIHELKHHSFHVRSLVYNLLKKVNLKYDQNKDLVHLVLEFFEYSEEEKREMLPLRKKPKH